MARGIASATKVLPAFMVGMLAFLSLLPLIPNISYKETSPHTPLSSMVVLPADFRTNMSLQYETILSKYTSASCSSVYDLQYHTTTLQNISVYDDSTLYVICQTQTNISYSTIAGKTFSYYISNQSSIPSGQTNLPLVLGGPWEHNYPWTNTTRSINNQEVTYLLYRNGPVKMMSITFSHSAPFSLGQISTEVDVYTGFLNITDYREG